MGLQIADVLKLFRELGVPVAYLIFTMLLLFLERRRTERAEAKFDALQAKLFELAQAQLEASLRSEAALSALLRQKDKTDALK